MGDQAIALQYSNLIHIVRVISLQNHSTLALVETLLRLPIRHVCWFDLFLFDDDRPLGSPTLSDWSRFWHRAVNWPRISLNGVHCITCGSRSLIYGLCNLFTLLHFVIAKLLFVLLVNLHVLLLILHFVLGNRLLDYSSSFRDS